MSHPPPPGESNSPAERLLSRGLDTRFMSERPAPPRLQIEWQVEGLLPKGGLTFLVAPTKSGKTTFLAHTLAAMTSPGGGSILGATVKPGRGLILTEENNAETVWRERSRLLSINPGSFAITTNPWRGRPSLDQWRQMVSLLAEDRRFDFLAIDTASEWLPYQNENDTREWKDALAPLKAIMEQGVSVVVLHHPTKGGISGPTSGRGSTAGPADAEVIINIEHAARGRVLTTWKRDGYGENLEILYGLEAGKLCVIGKEHVADRKPWGRGTEALRLRIERKAEKQKDERKEEAEWVDLSDVGSSGGGANAKYRDELKRYGVIEERTVGKGRIQMRLTNRGTA